MKKIITACIFLFLFFVHESASAQQGGTIYKTGQKVEAWNIAWYKATVLEVGTGDKAGYIKVHYDDFSSASDQYLKEASIRSPKNVAPNKEVSGPRFGRYTIQSYGGNGSNPIILGYFDLRNGEYQYYNAGIKLIGTGKYQYDAVNKKILWLSGGLREYSNTAAFEISREGKTHNIKLLYGTNASNSIDSK